MQNHPITWAPPEPLWKEIADGDEAGRGRMAAPAILRFATDDFMDEFLGVLATDPHRLGEYRVVPETWRGVLTTQTTLAPRKLAALSFQRFAAARQRVKGTAPEKQGHKPDVNGDTKEMPLKLYQPAHQRYYLVTSCLVCQLAGLPDRKVDAGKQEQSGFVMRRLLPPKVEPPDPKAIWREHAWIEKSGARYWQPVPEEHKGELFELDGQREEVLPFFAVNHTQDDQRQRRMFAGLIPVGNREAYLGASGGPEIPSGGVTSITARKALLRKEVIEPWKGLITRAEMFRKKLFLDLPPGTTLPNGDQPLPDIARKAALKVERANIQTASWFILLDLAKFLEQYAKPVWEELTAPAPPATPSALVTELKNIRVAIPAGTNPEHLGTALDQYGYPRAKIWNSLADALRAIKSYEPDLDKADKGFAYKDSPAHWADFLFPLADPEFPGQAAQLRDITLTPLPNPAEARQEEEDLKLMSEELPGSASSQERIDKLAALIVRAFDVTEKKFEPAVPLAARQPADPLEGWFVIRCVYSRPLCGKLHDDVVSAPTPHFQLAGFFDPDAPARPIRIGLPIDTTPAGLRKFDRNTAFMISDTLCGQIQRMKEITFGDLVMSILPWPFHRELSAPDKGPCTVGRMCSLSIPIITICALILLMIMVSLLEMIFHWMPFFIHCFPLPGLKAKKPPSSPFP